VAGFGLVRRSPALAGLLAAQTISPLGDAMATTALILHLQQTTGSATAVGLLLFAQAIPPLAAPFAGVVADRFAPGRWPDCCSPYPVRGSYSAWTLSRSSSWSR